jgi:hypothetical protein
LLVVAILRWWSSIVAIYTRSCPRISASSFKRDERHARARDIRRRLPPANAPIVSQNYTGWTPTKPDPAKTWAQVEGIDPNTLPLCQLFDPPSTLMMGTKAHPTWRDIGRWKKK